MTPAVVRALFGSCLALGVADLAWLNLNAPKMAVARAASPEVDESSAGASPPALAMATPPAPIAVASPVAPPPAIAMRTQEIRAEPSSPATAPPEPSLPSPSRDFASSEAPLTKCVVQFDRSRSFLRADETAHLVAIADTMKKHPGAVVRIEGHADRLAWRGGRGDNLTLSDDRASTVVRSLIKLGVPPDRIRRAAFGDTKPVDDRASEEAYRRNRRVEVRVDPRGDR